MEEREDDGPGVPDMTMMPQITEQAINDNLRRRYKHDLVYVSFLLASITQQTWASYSLSVDYPPIERNQHIWLLWVYDYFVEW